MPTPKEEVLRVLNKQQTRSINFLCFGLRVNAAFFGRVVEKVIRDRITCRCNPAALQPDEAAVYNVEWDYFNLGVVPCKNAFDESAIVHEATHAGADLMQYNPPWYVDEAIAYFAGSAYRLTALGSAGPNLCPADGRTGLHALAMNTMCNVSPGGEIPWGPFKQLCDAIKVHPAYAQFLRLGEGNVNNGVGD